MFVKPVEGRQVPDLERGGLVPPEGAEVPPTQYWQRRVQAGDVVISDPVTQAAPARKAKE